MSETFRPENEEQLRDAVAWAVSETAPLDIAGTGTKRGIGRAMQTQAAVDMSGMAGVLLYEPEELVLSARAGTLRSDVEAMLGKAGQEFAFEPPDFSKLLGSEHAGTLGGMTAGNLAGPRRIKAGAARDHFLGFRAVSGRGDIFQSGGRVVKNVTGYDLSKVLAGSWGTLGVMSQVTYKVLPAAETQVSVVAHGLSAADAVVAMSRAMQSSCDVSAAAYLPGDVSAASGVEGISGSSATVLRLEGIEQSVEFRADKLEGLLKAHGEISRLGADASRALWIEIRDVEYFAAHNDNDSIVWRVSVPPSAGAEALAAILEGAGGRGFVDWAGGLIWAELPVSDHGAAQIVRGSIAGCGGHATLIRAPQSLRSAIPVFEPQTVPLAALSTRLKNSFDPLRILNPGRMYP